MQTIRRCFRSGIEIRPDLDEVTVISSGSRSFVVLTRCMPTCDDLSYDYDSIQFSRNTQAAPPLSIKPCQITRFTVCLGDGRVPLILEPSPKPQLSAMSMFRVN